MFLLEAWQTLDPVWHLAGFAGLYLICVIACVPGMFLLSVAAGVYFGFALGLVLVFVSANLGSIVSFYLMRRYLRRWQRVQRWANRAHEFIQGSGLIGLVGLRLLSVLPYYGVTMALALSPVSVRAFALSTLIGMLPVHALFVWMGSRVEQVEQAPELLSHPWNLLLLGLGLCFLLAGCGRPLLLSLFPRRCQLTPTAGTFPSKALQLGIKPWRNREEEFEGDK